MWKMKTCINHINHYWKKWWLLKNNGWNSTLKLDKMYPFIPKCTHPFKAWTTHTHKQTHRHTDTQTHTHNTHTHTHTHPLERLELFFIRQKYYFERKRELILILNEQVSYLSFHFKSPFIVLRHLQFLQALIGFLKKFFG